MKTVTIEELKALRSEYQPTTEASIARIEGLDWPEEKKASRIARIRAAAEENAEALAKFDKVMSQLDSRPLPPDSHGADFDKAALWNGALLLVAHDPGDYQIKVPQYGVGVTYIRL